MWFWLAIIALLCWSGSDLFSKIGSKPSDKYSHYKMVMAVGLVMGLHACYEIFVNGVTITMSDFLAYLPVSFLYILSMTLGYVGLRYIELSISSPICNSSGALAALFCFLFLGQKMASIQTVAVILVCIGVVGLGIVEMYEDDSLREQRQAKANVKYSKSIIALLFPLLYCLIDALGTVADSIVLERLDEKVANTCYELTFLVMGILCFIYVVLIKKQKLTGKSEGPKLLGAMFETGGQFAYIFAISANAIAAAPVISSYCMASVLWSRIFLNEKLSWKHYLMIAICVIGIVILGMFEE
ncbi:MAG: DMT family transporter [Clostridiales bacterium]|nr:DMT family transporter [Clostridiales bacterium]